MKLINLKKINKNYSIFNLNLTVLSGNNFWGYYYGPIQKNIFGFAPGLRTILKF